MAKKRNYEVSVTAFATVLVIGAANKAQALEYACNTLDLGNMQQDEVVVKREIKTAEELEASRRHADCVSEDE